MIERLTESEDGVPVVPPYDIERELGHGGTATVYLARDQRHGRLVAVKVLNGNGMEGDSAARFLAEIKLTARLSHPHIVPLLDSGRAEGKPYFVMPFLEGGTLREQTQRGPMSTTVALKVAGEIADALAYAHAQGVLHRDVKPENIMMSGRNAVVADFGIARAIEVVDADARTTRVGMVLGTPAYMSPEQAAGEPSVDQRTDVYSLGAVLYEMLTGIPPFSGSSARSTIMQRFLAPPPSPRDRRSDLDEAVDAIVRRAMALDVHQRYDSAAELGDAIANVSRALQHSGHTEPTVADALPSIAVFPFENLGADPEDEFLGSGIADELLAVLSRSGAIRVAGRGSTQVLQGLALDVKEICRRLGVRTVLTGSVRRVGARMRVTATLVNGTDGFQLWADRYDRTLDDVFAVQDEIAGHICDALHATLLPSADVSHRHGGTANPDAYHAYLRGRHALARRTAPDMRRAQEWFKRALVFDPRYADAFAGVADAWALLGVYGEIAPATAFVEARAAAQSALDFEPTHGAAHAIKGLVEAAADWNFTAAEQSFQTAIRRSADPTPHQWLATMVLIPTGRFSQAIEETRRALRLDPLSPSARATLTVCLLYERRFEEALHAATEAVELESQFAITHFFRAQALAALGELDGALEAAEEARRLSASSGETTALAALCHGLRGEQGPAARLYAELLERSEARHVSSTHLALAAEGAGDREAALTHLEQAVSERAPDLIWLGVRAAWDSLRDEPRFEAVMQRVGVRTT